MNALGNSKKRRLSIKQREAVNQATLKFYSQNIANAEKSMQFILTIAMLRTLEEDYGFGVQRREKFKESFIKRINEISDELISNKCFEGDSECEVYDRECNLDILCKLSEYYNVEIDEMIFDY